jgi:deoxyxylulose-5-phosphate synthase
MADAIGMTALEDGRVGPPVRVLGTPVAFIPHGNADDILRELGLDADGVATETRRLLASLVHR